MITKVWIDESEEKCVYCGACEAVCDAVFGVYTTDHCVIKDADYSKYEVDIRDAAECCPVDIIKFAEDGKESKRKEEPRKEEPSIRTDLPHPALLASRSTTRFSKSIQNLSLCRLTIR